MLRFRNRSEQVLRSRATATTSSSFLLVLRQRTGLPDHRGELQREGRAMLRFQRSSEQELETDRPQALLVLQERRGLPDHRSGVPAERLYLLRFPRTSTQTLWRRNSYFVLVLR